MCHTLATDTHDIYDVIHGMYASPLSLGINYSLIPTIVQYAGTGPKVCECVYVLLFTEHYTNQMG